MKKVLCVLLCVIMLLPTVAFADLSGEFNYSKDAHSIYIAGDLSQTASPDGEFVTLLIREKTTGNIGYISQYNVDADGKYEAKFKFDGDLSDCEILVREGDNNVESGVSVAYAQTPAVCSLTLRDENGNNFIEPCEFLKLTATIENKYSVGGDYKLLVAFYDSEGKLLNCRTVKEGKYDFAEIKKEISAISDVPVPEDAVTIKAFLWSNEKTIIPLAKNRQRDVSDKKFGGEDGQIRVAFIGDSITHMGYYIRNIEHYYHTRYPNKDIVFINKGTSGNRTTEVINRFEWDIVGDEISGKIDEATIMIGVNNLGNHYNADSNSTQEDKDKVTDNFIADLEKIINLFKKSGVSLTIITPIVWDESETFENTTTTNKPGRNYYGLYNIVLRTKTLAEKYDVPVIDMWTATTELTERVRESYGYTGPIVTTADRIHPGAQGGVYIAYEFAKQQDGNPIVASVDIDANRGLNNTENATVNMISYDSTKVEYEYLAGAIPFAYTTHYKKFENDWEVPITEDINQEIIRVTGLEDGIYKIKIGENTLTKTYTAEELAEGVNIAIDDNNPAQIQSQEAFNLANTKAVNEDKYRGIAITEQQFRQKGLNYDDFNENMSVEEFKVVGSWPGSHKKYFSTDPDEYGSKMYEVENWEKLRQQEQAARDAAKPVQRTVVIEKR